jgi:hypothetical protein
MVRQPFAPSRAAANDGGTNIPGILSHLLMPTHFDIAAHNRLFFLAAGQLAHHLL